MYETLRITEIARKKTKNTTIMKKKILCCLMVYAFITINTLAQNIIYDSGTSVIYENGVVYSPDGFETIETSYSLNSDTTIISWGLYTKDGKILVSAERAKYKNKVGSCFHYCVAEGTVAIAKNAFRYRFSGDGLYFPTSIQYIDPEMTSSECSYNYSIIFYTGNSSIRIKNTDEESCSEEKSRYNIQGMKLQKPARGVNIVQYSDKTTKKVLVK